MVPATVESRLGLMVEPAGVRLCLFKDQASLRQVPTAVNSSHHRVLRQRAGIPMRHLVAQKSGTWANRGVPAKLP